MNCSFVCVILLTLGLGSSWSRAQSPADDRDFQTGDSGPADNKDSVSDPSMGVGDVSVRGGAGCKRGEVSAVISDDKRALSILFDNFRSSAGSLGAGSGGGTGTGPSRGRRNCDLTIPFQVPPGHRVTVAKLDVRGFNSLPAGARTVVTTQFAIVHPSGEIKRGGVVTRRFAFRGPLLDEFLLSSRMSVNRRPDSSRPDSVERLRWSPCGQNFNLQLGLFLSTLSNTAAEEAQTAVDSVDMDSETLKYSLLWQRCPGR
jgi:hypothetical protein